MQPLTETRIRLNLLSLRHCNYILHSSRCALRSFAIGLGARSYLKDSRPGGPPRSVRCVLHNSIWKSGLGCGAELSSGRESGNFEFKPRAESPASLRTYPA